MTHYTRLLEQSTSAGPFRDNQASPTLKYHKWHVYDGRLQDGNFETKESALPYLRQLSARINEMGSTAEFRSWRRQWDNFLATLPHQGEAVIPLTTVWRLVVGMGTNPALETGLTLHHLLGFPYVPGSAVKGLLHHAMELELAERWLNEFPGTSPHKPEDCSRLNAYLLKARRLRLIFGSITTQRPRDGQGEAFGPFGLRDAIQRQLDPAILSPVLLQQANWRSLKEGLDEVLEKSSAGLISFCDGVPQAGFTVDVDVLNPHYPIYYRTAGGSPPSDDQSPIPVYFLAVAPGVRFTFALRLARLVSSATDAEAFPGLNGQKLLADVSTRLKQALADWGIGAKTAAGYGYFSAPEDAQLTSAAIMPDESKSSSPEYPQSQPERPPEPTSPANVRSKCLRVQIRRTDKNTIDVLASSPLIKRIIGGEPRYVRVAGTASSKILSYAEPANMDIEVCHGQFVHPLRLHLHAETDAHWEWIRRNVVAPALGIAANHA